MEVSPIKLVPALLALTIAAPALAQVTIDSRGIRTGGTTIDATGVHMRARSVDSTGVHRGGGGGGGRTISANETTQAINCGGGSLTVNGANNKLTVTNCRAVTVAGNDNTMVARFGASGRLTVVGNDDHVSYSAAPGVSVAVSNVGTDSTVARR